MDFLFIYFVLFETPKNPQKASGYFFFFFKLFPLSPVIQDYCVQAHELGSKNKNRDYGSRQLETV